MDPERRPTVHLGLDVVVVACSDTRDIDLNAEYLAHAIHDTFSHPSTRDVCPESRVGVVCEIRRTFGCVCRDSDESFPARARDTSMVIADRLPKTTGTRVQHEPQGTVILGALKLDEVVAPTERSELDAPD